MGAIVMPKGRVPITEEAVLSAMRGLADKLGHPPSSNEWQMNFNRYKNAITRMGGFPEARARAFGEAHRYRYGRRGAHHTEEQLLQLLQDFYAEHGRVPVAHKDHGQNGLPTATTYVKRFGTMNAARVRAGIPALITNGWGDNIELSPERYAKYKARGGMGKARTATLKFEALQRRKVKHG